MREATLINWVPECSHRHQPHRFRACIAINKCLRPRRVRRSCNRLTTEAHVEGAMDRASEHQDCEHQQCRDNGKRKSRFCGLRA
jgi:hypothetical protein